MKEIVTMQHVALQYKEKEKADIFFKEILGLDILKDFKLSAELSEKIFGLSEEVTVFVYGNEESAFEVFITPYKIGRVFNHICIKVPDKYQFIDKCKNNNLEPYFVNKGEKKLLFVRDHSDNLYEIK